MAVANRKIFRIENFGATSLPASGPAGEDDGGRHREMMNAIAELRAIVQPGEGAISEQEKVSSELLDHYRAQHVEACKIREELGTIHQAIDETKRDIATLHHEGFDEEHMKAVSNELDAVVEHTEGATETILTAAESIDSNASNLSAALRGSEGEMAADIQDQVVKIFEACNFQDVTGQRINKVVSTLKFIEDRVTHMMEIWGGLENFDDVAVIAREKPAGDKALLNGPALDEDPHRASQDDIDALFN